MSARIARFLPRYAASTLIVLTGALAAIVCFVILLLEGLAKLLSLPCLLWMGLFAIAKDSLHSKARGH